MKNNFIDFLEKTGRLKCCVYGMIPKQRFTGRWVVLPSKNKGDGDDNIIIFYILFYIKVTSFVPEPYRDIYAGNFNRVK